MTNQTRSAVHDAATKAETLAYNLANASSLASVLSGELYGRIATCTAESPTRPHRRVRAHTEKGGVWPRSK